jgi:hypothetical protein
MATTETANHAASASQPSAPSGPGGQVQSGSTARPPQGDAAPPGAAALPPVAADDAEPPYSDEAMRRLAVERLADHLDIATGLMERCEHLAALPKGKRVEPIFAAARLMQADAQVAKALAQMAQVERRQRTIIERIQPPVPVSTDSNSNPVGVLIETLSEKMLRYMNVLADEKLTPTIIEAERSAAAKENLAATESAATPA